MCSNLAKCGPDLRSWRTCGTCRECRDRKIQDLVGRCIAEQYNPELVQTFAVDLTYRDNPDGSVPVGGLVLVYEHFSKFIDKLRDAALSTGLRYKDGKRVKRSVRFLVAGEYGSLKGRAHWHAILFIYDDPVSLPEFGRRVNWEFWPWGFSWLKDADRKAIAYAVKYALKLPRLMHGPVIPRKRIIRVIRR